MIKLDLNNVGWRALIDRIVALPGFPAPPNGAATAKATLDQMAANQNELIDRQVAVEGRLDALPFPFGAP